MSDNEFDPAPGPTQDEADIAATPEPAPDIAVVQPADLTASAAGTASGTGPRRRVALVAAALLLVGAGIAGGAAIATRDSSTAPQSAASTQAQSTPSTQDSTNDRFAGRGGAVAPQFDPSTGDGSASGTVFSPETATDATGAQSTGVVEITSTLTNGTAAGTGLILSADGTIVTNHHVVAGATSVKVTVVSTGESYTASYVGGNATADVAVLKLDDAAGLTPVSIAADAATAGDPVTAVGDAGGDGGTLTAATGSVTALDQDITVQNEDGTSAGLAGLIEMAAYVVPGDSGGVVLNSDGKAVGMNVAASQGGRAVTGYAIPIATVESIADQILNGNDTAAIELGYSGYLGVSLDPSSAEPLVVQVLQGGAAADAGITAGSTITAVNGTRTATSDRLRSLLAQAAAGDRVSISWTTSDGATHSTKVTLGRAPIG